jgi:hypothetical protein
VSEPIEDGQVDRWLRRGFALLALASAVPLWVVARPPIQDLPQHLAAIRVLHDYADPALGFARYFTLELSRTQYLAYYLSADLLAYPFGVETANRLLMSAFLVATPFALRALCEATGNDWRLATLGFALTYNAHLVLGFLNFLAAIPLCLYGLALCVRQRRAPRPARALGLSALALVCFYTHVVPFAFLALGVVLLAPWSKPRALLQHALLLAPAGLAALFWMLRAPAGQATLNAAAGGGSGPRAQFQPARAALDDLPNWLTDVFQGGLDRELLWVYGALLALCLLWGVGRAVVLRGEPHDALGRNLRLRLAALAPLAALAYFVMPTGYDWIWPIAQRFPLLALWLLIPVLPRPGRAMGSVVLSGAVLLGIVQFHLAGKAFASFERDELGEYDAALAHIPAGQRVAALIFDRGSRNVRFSPFIHYGAYYQAEKGGAVLFSFADFAQSPFRFREGNRPPRVPPRWEWLPERVDPERQLRWFDYLLVRGGPGRVARQTETYEPLFRSQRWSVWRRRDLSPATGD